MQATRKTRQKTAWAVLGMFVALAAVLAFWWFLALRAHAADVAAPPVAMEHTSGQVAIAERSPLRQTLAIEGVAEQAVEVPFTLPATIEADSARLVKVLPPLAGRIVSLDKRLGDPVKRGELLLRIDSPDLSQALSDRQKADAAHDLARRALERQRELGAADISAAREVEQARNDEAQAASELARAEARLVQLGVAASGVGARNAAPGHVLAVRSPIAGRVVDLSAAAGTNWNDTTAALMTVADLSIVFVAASADEKDLGALFVGQPARVVLDAYPGETFLGTVRYIGELLDPDTRRVKVRLQFDNRDGRLKPGMFAKVSFMARPHRALMVPLNAVVQRGFNARVFVEAQPWRFEPRVVQLGPRVGERVEVVAGLKVGERIVVKDAVLLDD